MRKGLSDGFELDDDAARLDRDEVHRFISQESYWARGRTRETMDALIERAQRVVGLYREGRQLGFSRTVTDGHVIAYLADVYVHPDVRGQRLGVELVRFSVDDGPYRHLRWLLHTADAHGLYGRFGFAAPDQRLLERAPSAAGRSSPASPARSIASA